MTPSSSYRLGIIGFGNLGRSLAHGLIDHPSFPIRTILTLARGSSVKSRSLFPQVKQVKTIHQLHAQSDILFLAVKPKNVEQVLEELRPLSPKPFISGVGGWKIEDLHHLLSSSWDITRVMPNLAISLGCGVTGIYGTGAATSLAEKIFSSLGVIARLREEDHVNIVTSLGASAPAFLALAIEAMAAGAVKMGLSRAESDLLVLGMAYGTSSLLANTGETPHALISRICTPAGTTIAGLHALEKASVRGAFMTAIEAATQRSREMSKGAAITKTQEKSSPKKERNRSKGREGQKKL